MSVAPGPPAPWRGSRRRFLQASAGLAGALLAACRGGGEARPGDRTPITPSPTTRHATSVATPVETNTPGSGGPARGGTLRFTGFVVSDGEFDPHKTQSPPLAAYQSLVFSRLLTYESQAAGMIGADLAIALPESPDPLTYVLRLNPRARWDDAEPLAGRPVTADDVRFSIERQRDGDPSFVRRPHWLNIETIDSPAPDTVILRLKEPLATTLHRLADVHSFIVAPEAAEAGFTASFLPGSGPFRAVEWNEGHFASVVANSSWFGGNDRPYLDGISIEQPRDAVEVEASLRTRKLDVAFVDRPVADRLRAVIPELVEIPTGLADFFGMRFFVPGPPYDDVRLRTALARVIDRREMIREFFADSGEVNPWVSWPIQRWSLPQVELARLPGYRPGASGRAQDVAEAQQLLAAYREENDLEEPLELLVVDEAERTLRLGSLIRDQVAAGLGLEVSVTALPLADIVSRLLERKAPWVAGPDSGWIDLDDWLYPYFHSEGTKNSFALRDEGLDESIVAQRFELDADARQELGYQIQRQLLEINAGVNFVSERAIALSWPYVRSFPLDATDGFQGRLADCWLDPADPTFIDG